MSDRANGGHHEKFQDDVADVELSGLIDSTTGSSPIPDGQHGVDKYGPAPAGGALHAAFDRVRQLLGGSSKADGWAGGFSPVSDDEPDPSYPGATQGVVRAAAASGHPLFQLGQLARVGLNVLKCREHFGWVAWLT